VSIFNKCKKNVEINFSAHDSYLESPSSSTLKDERLKNQYSVVNKLVIHNMYVNEHEIRFIFGTDMVY
jgi:hypothetical protein